jgi:hypothetical protein
MKLKTFILFFSVYFFSASPVFSQEFNFQKSWADYIYTSGQYQQTSQRYSNAKQTYNTYQTLSTKNEAVTAGISAVKSREELVRTYLVMLRMKLSESRLSLDVNKQEKINNADILVSWLEGRKTRIDAIGNIDDLNNVSAEFENKYPEIEALSYKMIGAYKTGEMGLVIERITNLKNELRKKSKNLSDQQKIEFDRSVIQVEEKITLAKTKRQQAISELEALSDKKTKNYLAVWQKSRSALIDCQQYLREVLVFMEELSEKNE